ncbi:MAG: glycosyltransferase family 39 protein [Candidatus Altiarchaeota archaeon]
MAKTRKKPNRSTRKPEGKREMPYNLVFGALIILLFSHRFVNIAWTDDFQNDEGIHALISSTLLKGGVIYKDFDFGHPPLMPYIGAAYMSVNEVGLMQVRFLAILSSVLTAMLVYFIVRDVFGESKKTYFATLVAVVPMTLLTLVNSISRVYYIEPFVTFLSFASVYAATKKTQNAYLVSGFLGAAALLTKFWALPAVAAILVYLVWMDRKNLRYFLLGFFTAILPFLVYLAGSEKATQDILWQMGRGRWTLMQKTKPVWSFYKALPFLSIASIPILFLRRHRIVFLYTLATIIFFYTLMPDAVSHHTYFMLPVFTLSAAILASEVSPKNMVFWIIIGLIIYSIAEKQHIRDIQSKMKSHGVKLTNVAKYVAANTDKDDAILSDYMMISFIADRRQAGYLVDVSEAAIFYDTLTSEKLITISEKEKPEYIIIESRFKNKKLASFTDYINEKYVKEEPPFQYQPFELYRRK